MEYRKTEYIFNVPDINLAHNYITDYLNRKGFKYIGNGKIMLGGSAVDIPIYKRQTALYAGFIEYIYIQNRVYIYAYANNPKHPVPLDGGLQGALAAVSYRSDIDDFITYLDNMSKNVYYQQASYGQQMSPAPNTYPNMATPSYQQSYQQQPDQQNYAYQNNPQNQYQNQYQNRAVPPQNKVPRSENFEMMTILGFIGSIMSLLLSIIGKQFGVLIIVMCYAFAIKGLKRGVNKGMNTATIIILSVALFISFIWVLYGFYLASR